MAEDGDSASGPFGAFSDVGSQIADRATSVEAPDVDLEEIDEDITETAESTLDNEDASFQDAFRTGLARVQESQQFIVETQTAAATGETPEVPEQRSDEEFAEDVQEGVIGTREDLAEGAQEAGEGTPADSRAGEFLGQFSGSVFDAVVTDPAASAFKGATGIDPLGERETFESGDDQVDRDEAVTGNTDEPFTGEDAFNVATTGTALAGSAAAAKFGVKGLTKGAQAGKANIMGITSLLDDAGALTRSADSGVAASDDILRAPSDDTGALADMSFDEFSSVDSTVGSSDEATQATGTADELQFEENLQNTLDESLDLDRLETPRPTGTDLGPRASFEADTALGFGDDAVEFGDDASAADDTIEFADDAEDAGDESFIRGLFNVGDDVDAGADDFGSAARSASEQSNAGAATRAVDDTAEAARSGDSSGGLFSRLSPSTGQQIAAVGLVGGGGALGAQLFGGGGGGAPPDVPRVSGPYSKAGELTANGEAAILMQIQPDTGTSGYAVLLGGPPLSVLSESGRAVSASVSLSAIRNGEPGLEARFATTRTARRVFREWANSQGSSSEGRSTEFDGTLSAPDSVRRGKRLTAEAVVRNTSRTDQSNATFVLALDNQGGQPSALARERASVGPDEEVTVEFSAGTRGIEPGDYTLALYATSGGNPGKVDSTSLSVDGSDDRDSPEERTKWGDAARVRELPGGWTLYQLRSKDGSETGFVVAGTREDSTKLYLSPGGEVREDAYVFESQEAALEAASAWIERNQAGNTKPENTPSEATQSPSPESVRQAAAESDTGPISGILSAMSANPLFAVGGVALLGGAVYYVSDGKPVAWLNEQTGGLLGTGGA